MPCEGCMLCRDRGGSREGRQEGSMLLGGMHAEQGNGRKEEKRMGREYVAVRGAC